MKYIKIIFTITPDTETAREIVSELAADAGCNSFIEENGKWVGYCQKNLFDENCLKEQCANFPMSETSISYVVNDVEDKNWNEEWEKNGFSPIIIKDRCVICSAADVQSVAEKITADLQPLIVQIVPQQAFGTGQHETTQMMVEQLLNEKLVGKSLLDCGCGTGILGIVAKQLGAEKVCAYDIDDWSVRNAQSNATLNDTTIDIKEGNRNVIKDFKQTFDVILANINRNILLEDMDTFVANLNPQGKLFLSGFYAEDAQILEEKALSLGLQLCHQQTLSDWCCLVLQRV